MEASLQQPQPSSGSQSPIPPSPSFSISANGASERERKKRARNLLRDYYGLNTVKGDPMDIDSASSFNPELYFNSISTTLSLPELLQRENQLLTEMRELDGERQSLVYNHHHELIEASDTIKKMKSRAVALDTSLDALRVSFEAISQLATALAPVASTSQLARLPPSADTDVQTTPKSRRLAPISSPNTPTAAQVGDDVDTSSDVPAFDPLLHLPALLALPILMRSLLESSKPLHPSTASHRPRSNSTPDLLSQLWGVWEPALRSWEDAEVQGVREIGKACREVLRGAGRRSSVSIAR